ncbi:MAG: CHAT domain-containing protein [Bacteroidota bacterium]
MLNKTGRIVVSGLLSLLLFSIGSASAQSAQNDSLIRAEADTLFQQATEADSLSLAHQRIDSALHLYHSLKDTSNWTKCYQWLSRVYAAYQGPDESAKVLQKAIASCWWPENGYTGILYMNLGRRLNQASQIEAAGHAYENCIRLYLENDKDGPILAQYAMHPLGNIYTRLGEYDKAEYYLGKVLDTYIQEQITRPLASLYSDLGVLHRSVSDPEQALRMYQKALALQSDPSTRALILANQAECYIQMGQCQEAVKPTRKALRIFQDAEASSQYLIGAYTIMGAAASCMGNMENARQHFQDGLRLLQTPFHRQRAKIQLSIAETFEQERQLDSALFHCQKALHALLPGFQEDDPALNPSPTLFTQENTLQDALTQKGQIYEALYRQSEDIGDIRLALQNDLAAIEVGDIFIRNFSYENSQLSQLHGAQAIYEHAIKMCWILYQTESRETYAQQAFELAERSKANLLLQGILDQKAKSFAGIPESLLQEEQNFKKQISQLETHLFQLQQSAETDAEAMKEVKAQIFTQKTAHDAFLQKLENQYSAYYQLKYPEQRIQLDKIRQHLRSDEQLLEYFIGSNHRYLFLVNKTELDWTSLQTDFPLDSLIKDFRHSLTESWQWASEPGPGYQDEVFLRSSHQLYLSLLAPVEKKLSARLLIIPDGQLGYIPFDALLKQQPHTKVFRADYDFLIRSHTICYAYSARSLVETKSRVNSQQNGMLAIAPTYKDLPIPASRRLRTRDTGLDALFASEEEAKNVHAIWQGALLTGVNAGKSQFQKLANSHRYIHFSGHASVNSQQGKLSYLAFSLSQGDSLPYLYLSDLYAMNLDVDMMVLSACETGLGRLYPGEGIASLARGCSFAGARSIITTLWSVEDQITSELMKVFYQELAAGSAKDDALRKARLHLLDQDYAPFFWAAYIPIGDMRAVDSPVGFPWLWILISLGFLAAALMIFFSKKIRLGSGELSD